MRRLSAGNKSRFVVFAIIICIIILVLVLFLNKSLQNEKEIYDISKGSVIYDENYEYISLSEDAKLEKNWTGKYYLTEGVTGKGYTLGKTAIVYNTLKNRVGLYGTFYEIALDGEVTKTNKYTDVADTIESRIFKIEDRKYLIVADTITNESGTISAENYLIVIIDKAGNTLLLNDTMNVKTINAIMLNTDSFTVDVANEKLILETANIDLKKVIGSTHQYIEPEKHEEEGEEGEGEDEESATPVIASINNGSATASSTTTVNTGGSTTINIGNTGSNNGSNRTNSNQGNNNNNNNNNNNINNNQYINQGGDSQTKNKLAKSASLRNITPGETFIDVEYTIVDPDNEYQVVYIAINGGGTTDNISLDKTKSSYRITGLKQNTDYSLVLGYREIKSDSTVEEVTEDIINVKTTKLSGSLDIVKVTEKEIFYNIQLDPNSDYENARISLSINGNVQPDLIVVDVDKAVRSGGWTSSIAITDEMNGKITLNLLNVADMELTTSAQIY